MATLTTNWQELGSATLYNNIVIKLDGRIDSQSTTGNYSIAQFRFRNTGTYWRTTNGEAQFDGAFTDSQSCATYPSYIYDGDTIFTITKTINHNDDGNKSINIGGSLYAYINSAKRTANISQVSVSMPKINRKATITGATDFNDESNPTISFTNPAGFRINVKLEFGSNFSQIIIRNNISNTGSYTFSLTNEERNLLRQYCTGKTMVVRETIATCINGDEEIFFDWQDKTMSIVNADPTATYTITEQDAKVISLLNGDTTKIIKNASDLLFTITPTALKGATISSVKINNATATQSGNNYVLNVNNITTGTFSILITDSRGFSNTYQATKTILDYIACKINTNWSIERATQTSSDLVLNASVNVWNSTINGTSNTIVVKYSLDNENWTTISSSDYTISNNVLTISNLTLSNLISYQQAGTFYLDVSDLLSESKENKAIKVGIYTLAKSDRKVRINGTLEIADANGQNRKEIRDLIYPVGSVYLSVINVNPSTLFGGTWEKIYGGYLYGAGQKIDKTTYEGWGTQSHTLTTDEIPSHNHESQGWAEVTDGSGSYKVFGAVSGGSSSGVGTKNTGGGLGHTHNIATMDVFVWKRIA